MFVVIFVLVRLLDVVATIVLLRLLVVVVAIVLVLGLLVFFLFDGLIVSLLCLL